MCRKVVAVTRWAFWLRPRGTFPGESLVLLKMCPARQAVWRGCRLHTVTITGRHAQPNQFPFSMDQITSGRLMVGTCSLRTRFRDHNTLISYWFFVCLRWGVTPLCCAFLLHLWTHFTTSWCHYLLSSSLLLLVAGLLVELKSQITSAWTSQNKKNRIPTYSFTNQVQWSTFCPLKN